MRLRTLGGLSLSGVSFRRPKPLLLLTYLALEGRKDRRFLTELFWPRASNPRQSLSVALSQLRAVAPAALSVDGSTLGASVECDAVELVAATAAADWRGAADLYGGAFLSGLDVADGNVELEEWLFQTRETVAAEAQRAFVELAEEGLREGDRLGAVRLAEQAAALLTQVVDVDPERLTRLHALLTTTDSPRALPLRREAAELGIDLTAFSAPQEPPDAVRAPSHNLPRRQALFVGREAELRDLEGLVDEGARLITVTGLGGIGKTRLALELAWRLQRARRFDPIYFVPLETLTEPAEVLGHVARSAQVPAGRRDPISAIAARFASTRPLFVLDNFEQLGGAAPDVGRLLEACPGLTLLVTSREPLGLEGESLYPVTGLPLPSAADEAPADDDRGGALSLFVQAARRFDARFGLTEVSTQAAVSVCRRLAGSPLGIELAAALTRLMPLEELARELEDDLDTLVNVQEDPTPRHSDLRTVFESSWQRLTLAQRRALAGASVFEGGFDRAAAKAVLGMDLPTLAVLIDRALVARQGRRYDLHPLVRQYAAEKLAETRDAGALRARHAEHYAAFLVARRAAYRRVAHRAAFEEIDGDYPNVRAAWVRAAAGRDEALLGRMVPMLTDYLWVRSRFHELTRQAELALGAVGPDTLLAGHLAFALALPHMDSAPAQARPLFERALELGARHGDDGLVGMAHYRLGRAFAHAGAADSADEHYRAALPLLEHHDDGMSLGGCICNLGLLAADHPEAGRLLEEAAAVSKRAGNVLDQVNILQNLACHVRDSDGDYARALRHVQGALALEAAIGRRGQLVALNEWAAYYYLQLSDLPAAELHLAEVARLVAEAEPWEEHPAGVPANDRMMAHYHFAAGDLARGLLHARKATESGDCLLMVAWADVIHGDLEEAARLLAELRVEVQDYLDAVAQDESSVRLLAAAVTASSAVDAGTGPGSAAAPYSQEALNDILVALDLVLANELVPQALTAFMAAHVVAPELVGPELLELAATHPAGRQVTRRLAAERLAAVHGARPASDPGGLPRRRTRQAGRDEVLERARQLRTRLRAVSATAPLERAVG